MNIVCRISYIVVIGQTWIWHLHCIFACVRSYSRIKTHKVEGSASIPFNNMVSCARKKDISKEVELEYRPKAQDMLNHWATETEGKLSREDTIMSTHRHWSHSKSFQHTVPLQHTPHSRPFINQQVANSFHGYQKWWGIVPGLLWSFLKIHSIPIFFGYHFGSPFPSFPIHNVACVLALESLHKSCHRTALGPAIRDGRLRRFCRFAVYAFCIPRGTALSFLIRTCKSVFGRPSSTEILGNKAQQTSKQRSEQGEMETSSICKATGTYRINGRKRPNIAGWYINMTEHIRMAWTLF